MISLILNEEKPVVLEKEKTGNEEELSPSQLDEVIEDEWENDTNEEQKPDNKNIPKQTPIKVNKEQPIEEKINYEQNENKHK